MREVSHAEVAKSIFDTGFSLYALRRDIEVARGPIGNLKTTMRLQIIDAVIGEHAIEERTLTTLRALSLSRWASIETICILLKTEDPSKSVRPSEELDNTMNQVVTSACYIHANFRAALDILPPDKSRKAIQRIRMQIVALDRQEIQA